MEFVIATQFERALSGPPGAAAAGPRMAFHANAFAWYGFACARPGHAVDPRRARHRMASARDRNRE